MIHNNYDIFVITLFFRCGQNHIFTYSCRSENCTGDFRCGCICQIIAFYHKQVLWTFLLMRNKSFDLFLGLERVDAYTKTILTIARVPRSFGCVAAFQFCNFHIEKTWHQRFRKCGRLICFSLFNVLLFPSLDFS